MENEVHGEVHLGVGRDEHRRRARRRDGGALAAYGRSSDGLRKAGREAVEYLAAVAGLALAGARRVTGLLDSVESRDVIGQAKGMLMLRDGVEADQAFASLVAAPQHANVELRDVAAWLVASGGAAR